MVTIRGICYAATLPLALLLTLPFHGSARADTYVIYALGGDEGSEGAIRGIDSSGDVYIPLRFGGQLYLGVYDPLELSGFPAILGGSGPTYLIPYDTPLDLNSGTPCDPVAGAFLGLCNNGHEAYALLAFNSYGVAAGIYDGPDPYNDYVDAPVGNGIVFLFIDPEGDIAFTDGTFEENYEAYDLTSRQTPEPNTFVFMATGILGLAGAVRRRLR
jgi:hypothetical protein